MLLDCEEVDVDAKDLKGDTTPLLLAIKEKHMASAKLLVENGASLNVKVGRSTLKEQFCKMYSEIVGAHYLMESWARANYACPALSHAATQRKQKQLVHS